MDVRNSVCRWILLASALALPAAALAVQDCEINGQHVNPANGGTTEGKTGIMKCRDRDSGKLVREEEYRNGRSVGYRKFIELTRDTIIANYNERGNRAGESSKTRWQRDGTNALIGAEEFWDNGQIRARTVRDERLGYVGVQQGFDEAGVLVTEKAYDKGVLTRRKLYKAGRLVTDEEYYADGSRK